MEKRVDKNVFVWVGAFLLGGFGVDRFMRGQTGLGILKALTCGGCGIWALIDLIIALTKAYGPYSTEKEITFINGDYSKNEVNQEVYVSALDNTRLNQLKRQIATIEKELDASYTIIGKRYTEYIINTGTMGDVDVRDILKILEPRIMEKKEIEAEIVEVEKKSKDQDDLREKQVAEQEFIQTKSKLDKALQMGVIAKEEYDLKLSIAQKKYNNFEEIRRIETQYNMGIISIEEKNAKISALN